MLTRITARNFKAFGESPGLDLSLSAFNLFLGENNSGKTSALDVGAILVQSARDQSQAGPKWSGELVDLGVGGQYAWHNALNKTLELSIELTAPAGFLESIRELIGTSSASSYTARTIGVRVVVTPGVMHYKYEFLVDGQVHVRNLLALLPLGGNRPLLEIRDFPSPNLTPLVYGGGLFDPNSFTAGGLDRNNDAHKLPAARMMVARAGVEVIREFLARRVFFVGSNRGTHSEGLDDIHVHDVGRNGQRTLQVLSAVFARPEFRGAAAKIRQWAQVFGLAEISSGWAGGSALHSGYIDELASASLPLRSAGFGSQQILPIIVQLFASPIDSTVIVEEPEISLHPAAQVQLLNLFRDAATPGRQIIVTTHSQYLVMALQEKGSESSPSDAAVYHFSREGSESKAERLSVDADGILTGWVPSFADVERNLLSGWISRVHDKLKSD